MWTQFWDMHSGGSTKEPPYQRIYIEADEQLAKIIFYNRFGHNPERVTCTCCGEDYSISSHESLEFLTAYNRGCSWNNQENDYNVADCKHSLDEYLKQSDVLIISKDQIKDSEKVGSIPVQGYVWID